MTGTTNIAQDSKSQPWKSVWPPASGVANQDSAVLDGLSDNELTNQRAYGSHASNTKGKIVHIMSTMCRCNNSQLDHESNKYHYRNLVQLAGMLFGVMRHTLPADSL